MRLSSVLAYAVMALVGVSAPLAAREPEGGVHIGRPSLMRRLVPASWMEKQSAEQYAQLTEQAAEKHALLPEGNPTVERVRAIARLLLPHAQKFNERAKDWDWEVNVLNSKVINAFCMPGGKIAVFTGIIDQLGLSDDELAMVMGHEIAHALREHARARQAKQTLTQLGVIAVEIVVGGNLGELARAGGGLLNLKFSRNDETEADLVGMELAARAGYDPRSGVTLWEKMSRASQGAPPAWLSTHPSNANRVATIKAHLQEVMPIYEEVRSARN
jgi:predicted Zn-dependent protease